MEITSGLPGVDSAPAVNPKILIFLCCYWRLQKNKNDQFPEMKRYFLFLPDAHLGGMTDGEMPRSVNNMPAYSHM